MTGPYFAVEAAADGPGWRPLSALLDDPALLGEQAAVVRRLLAQRCGVEVEAIDARAATSIQFLGFVARLAAPAYADAVLHGTVRALAPDSVYWQAIAGGPVPIAITGGTRHPAGSPDETAELLGRSVIRTVVAPLVDAVRGVSARVLWGNVASAFGGAMVMLSTERATAIMESLLDNGILAGTGRLTSHGFVRNSCCLFYRIPDGGTCADCILNERS
jgi:hypothetical protein